MIILYTLPEWAVETVTMAVKADLAVAAVEHSAGKRFDMLIAKYSAWKRRYSRHRKDA